MAELKCKDGTVIKISDETEAELRKAFGPQLPYYESLALRVFINGNLAWPITIKVARDLTSEVDFVTRSVKSVKAYIKALQEAVTYCERHGLGL